MRKAAQTRERMRRNPSSSSSWSLFLYLLITCIRQAWRTKAWSFPSPRPSASPSIRRGKVLLSVYPKPFTSPSIILKATAITSIPSSIDDRTTKRKKGGGRKAVPPQDSVVAEWHKARRAAILKAHPEIASLERPDWRAIPLLAFTNLSHVYLACLSSVLPTWATIILSCSIGATLSLWQLNILHDVLHGNVVKNPKVKQALLFWGSLPSVFGYYLYLRFGHLSHHQGAGEASMEQVFASDQENFEDGDILFVSHRMKIAGKPGPSLPTYLSKFSTRPLSIAWNAYDLLWKEGEPLRNGLAFSFSFIFERIALCLNDKIVALFGFNAFFPNKPASFHQSSANFARVSAILQLLLVYQYGWSPLLYLLFSECAWSLPFHPASAMFITNHGSAQQPPTAQVPAILRRSSRRGGGGGEKEHASSSSSASDNGIDRSSSTAAAALAIASPTASSSSINQPSCCCQPTSSTYAGWWYDLICLNTNYHVEHHDFPKVGLFDIQKVKEIAAEFYDGRELRYGGDGGGEGGKVGKKGEGKGNPYDVIQKAFASPEFYACMGGNRKWMEEEEDR